MPPDSPRPVTRLYLASLATLLSGLALSATLYVTAADVADNQLVEGFRNSKVYRHDLEVYGGKMSLLADGIGSWFSGLWQGRPLGITVACISVAVALMLFGIARLDRGRAPATGAGKGAV